MTRTNVPGPQEPTVNPISPSSRDMERIGSALRGLRYGSVHVVVQDGKIVQIERTEKFRLPRPPDRVPERAP